MHSNRLASLTVLLGMIAIPLASQAQDAEPAERQTTKPAEEPIVLGQRMLLHSELLAEERSINVSTPDSYEEGSARFGVIYLLDGPAHFAHVTANVGYLAGTNRALPLIVVAVANTDRTRDLTPPPATEGEDAGKFPTAGGSATFRRFLVDELQPFIDERYRTSGMNILIGHSFGGLFAVEAMLEEPGSFSAFFALSPSLWWNAEKLVNDIKELKSEHGLFKKFVYLSMGDEGKTMNPPFEAAVWSLRDKAPSTFGWSVGRFPGEDHGSVPLAAIQNGLRAYFAPVREASDLEGVTDVAELDRRFTALSARFGVEISTPEFLPTRLGFQLVNKDLLEEALAVLQVAHQRAPKLGWPCAALGECLEKQEKFEDACQQYELGRTIGAENENPSVAGYCSGKLEALRERMKSGDEGQ